MVKLIFRYPFCQYISPKYKNTNKAIFNLNWIRAFENLSVDKKVELLFLNFTKYLSKLHLQ